MPESKLPQQGFKLTTTRSKVRHAHQSHPGEVTFLPNDKVLGFSKLKALADDKLNVAIMIIPVFDRLENILGKGENADYQHFLLFPQCFPKGFSLNV